MDLPIKPQVIESDYEVKLGVFEGPLDLLLYLVQKNELNPREIAISTITDQYLLYIDGIEKMNLSNAGEFLVMAARLMRLKARELLPADQKDELEEMEYELDRQALIQQMLEYQKFKEAARVLRNFEGRNFGAFARGREDSGDDRKQEELEEEAGIFDLLSAFRSVVVQRPKRIPVHEVEIDDVTIEDRMQEVEIALNERGRSQFEDLFPHDNRTIVKVVTLMAMLELCKLDRVVFRQSHAMGAIWVYRKAKSSDYELELKVDEGHQEPLPEFKAGLPELVREQAKQRTAQTALEAALRELENELLNPGQAAAAAEAATAAAAAEAATAAAEQAMIATEDPTEAVGSEEALESGEAAEGTESAEEAAEQGSSAVETAEEAGSMEAGSVEEVAVETESSGVGIVEESAGAAEAEAPPEAIEPSTEATQVVAVDAVPVADAPQTVVGQDTTAPGQSAPPRGAWRRPKKTATEAPAPGPAEADETPKAGSGGAPEAGSTGAEGIAEAPPANTEEPASEAETAAEKAALKDLMDRMREAPEPDLSVPGTDDEDD